VIAAGDVWQVIYSVILLSPIWIVILAALVHVLRRGSRVKRGFEVMKKPTSGLTPEQREREAHHG
jgi:hypothetical protein